jgi:hypothetical protein
MDVHRQLAARQRDLVAAWQLIRAGWTRAMVDHYVGEHQWQQVHRGVYCLSYSPLSVEQRRMAATLSAPRTFLAHYSAGAHYGIWRFDAGYETVVRPGNRGRERSDGLLVRYSTTLRGSVGVFDGVPITSPERTSIDSRRTRIPPAHYGKPGG